VGELFEAPLEAGPGDDPVHLAAEAPHLGEADVVDFLQRAVRGGHLAHPMGVLRLAVAEVARGDGLAGRLEGLESEARD
jgi:hypothetical protein